MPLEGKQLGFRYNRQDWLFRNVSITIKPGEAVGILGPSGCGKTTLGQVLAGFAPAMEGHVLLQGQPLPHKGCRPVQIVFQHPEKAVNPRWRIGQILTESWTPDGDFLDRLGIDEAWLARWPHELSGGELQRICIARALGPATRYLIADEMTTMLDAITQAQIWHAVLDIANRRGLGLAVISHDSNLIERLCHRRILWETLCAAEN